MFGGPSSSVQAWKVFHYIWTFAVFFIAVGGFRLYRQQREDWRKSNSIKVIKYALIPIVIASTIGYAIDAYPVWQTRSLGNYVIDAFDDQSDEVRIDTVTWPPTPWLWNSPGSRSTGCNESSDALAGGAFFEGPTGLEHIERFAEHFEDTGWKVYRTAASSQPNQGRIVATRDRESIEAQITALPGRPGYGTLRVEVNRTCEGERGGITEPNLIDSFLDAPDE